MKQGILTTILVLAAGVSEMGFAHCLVPEKAEWHFICAAQNDDVEVEVLLFSDSDPRNCPSVVNFIMYSPANLEPVKESFLGGKPVFRRIREGVLEILTAFGSQNHVSVSYQDTPEFPGYIEFGGGPSWKLDCTAQPTL